ncbi:SurA N-terminal domain-containing protein [Endomicrobium proavitum]|uniref:Peptidylprolyl isomerase n=1 Tax=Endomicrobium proavitum TaxID=1408281 RepID=A0A0G3WIX2_9BACT|nr:SurA N-terminal domain-containing protein [Endomicrobium proavitum]AKL98263.1 exported protein of unknown function [Endomicrobium proavitum]
MMNFLRKHNRKILILVIVVFVGSIFWIGAQSLGGGAADDRSIAKVYGEKIPFETYMSMYSISVRTASNNSETDLTDEQKNRIKTSILYELVQTEVMSAQAKKYGVTVSDAELDSYLQSNPMFRNNNAFDARAYFAFLNELRMTPNKYEELTRKQIAGIKLQRFLFASVKVFDNEFAAAKKVNSKIIFNDLARAKSNQILNEWYMGLLNDAFADGKIIVNEKLLGEI